MVDNVTYAGVFPVPAPTPCVLVMAASTEEGLGWTPSRGTGRGVTWMDLSSPARVPGPGTDGYRWQILKSLT